MRCPCEIGQGDVAGGKPVPVEKVLLREAKEAACDFSSQDRFTRHVPLQGSACHGRTVANLASRNGEPALHGGGCDGIVGQPVGGRSITLHQNRP